MAPLYLRLLGAALHDAAAGFLEVEGQSPGRVGLLQLVLGLGLGLEHEHEHEDEVQGSDGTNRRCGGATAEFGGA
jgi:hypothetical protein